jgi:hyperosmotically inducible protein
MRMLIRPMTSKLTPILLAITILFTLNNSLIAAEKANQAPRDAQNYQVWLTKEVRHQLVTLPYYSVFDNLQYTVDGTKVTLLGEVTNPALKSDAEKAVKSIEGVGIVDNQLKVLPLSPMDDRIRRAEYRAIYSFPSLQMYSMRAVPPIHIIVENGHVTLEGTVATQADKDAAGVRANGVSGVFSVMNNLHVEKSSG